MAELRAKLGLDNAEFNTGLQQAKVRLEAFAEGLSNPVSSLGKMALALPAIGGVIGLLAAGVGIARSLGEGLEAAFKSAMKRQELVADFQAFYGSVEAATAKIKEFSDYARHTSFNTSDVAEGALRLEVLSNGALQGAKVLHMVGDVATDTEKTFTEVATAMGWLYSKISAGGAIERPLVSLEKMGVITPVVTAKIKDMIAAGASTAETWKIVTAQFDVFKGTTENVAETASGSLDKVRNNISAIFQGLSMPIVSALTPWLKRTAEESDSARTSLSSWTGILSNLLRGIDVVAFVCITNFKNIGLVVSEIKTIFDGFFQIVGTGAYTIAAVTSDIVRGNLSGALTDLKTGAATAVGIVKDTGDKLASNFDDRMTGMKADYAAMRQSIMDLDHPPAPPDTHKQTDFDPEDGDPEAGNDTEIKAKRQELADLESSAREKTMTDLEKINDLEARRNALIAKAQWWKDHLATLNPAQDEGAIKSSTTQMLENQVSAAKLDEQIGSITETREERIAALKEKIQERADKLLGREERLAALRTEAAALDLTNADEEMRLKAIARKDAIADEIKEVLKEHGAVRNGVVTGQITGENATQRQGNGHQAVEDLATFGGTEGSKDRNHHGMDELAGLAGKGLPNFLKGAEIAPVTEAKKQTDLQVKIEKNTALTAEKTGDLPVPRMAGNLPPLLLKGPLPISKKREPVFSGAQRLRLAGNTGAINPAMQDTTGKQIDLAQLMVKSLQSMDRKMQQGPPRMPLATFGN